MFIKSVNTQPAVIRKPLSDGEKVRRRQLKAKESKFYENQEKVEFEMHKFWAPHEGQAPVAYALFREFKRYVFMQCGRKLGKALALNTPILTPSGFKPIGDIVDGDIVYDEKGREQTVIHAHEVIKAAESYRVHFCNGEYIDACKDHRWLTHTKLDRKSFKRYPDTSTRKPTVKTTLELFETQMHGKEYNHSIPYTEPVQFARKDQTLDPYLLGMWLGDGNTHRAGFSSIDKELIQAWKDKGYGVTHYSGCDYGITGGLKVQLRELGLLKNKHIPNNYLMGDVSQRLALVQGLMDTDGWISKKGEVAEYYSSLPQLADGMHFLLSSLGMKPIRKVKKTTHKDCHVIRFKPLLSVFRLKRKLERITTSKKSNHHTIVKVEKIENVDMRCLTVTGDSSLYLAGTSMIPTHNTDLAIYCMYMFAMLFPNSQIYYIADTMKHAGELVWENGRLPRFFLSPKKWHWETEEQYKERRKWGAALHEKWIVGKNESEMRITFSNGSFIKCDGAENYANADGIEPDFIVYDEFKHHDKRYNEAMEPNLRVKRAPLLIVGTPPEELGTYYEKIANSVKRASYGFFCRRPSYLNPVLYPEGEQDPDFQEEVKKYVDRQEDDVLRRELYAEIVLSGSKAIFPVLELPKYDWDNEEYIGYSRHVKSRADLLSQVKHRPKDWEYYCVFDPASSSCFGVLLLAMHKVDKRVFILDEIYERDQRETTTRKIIDRARDKWRAIYGMDDVWTLPYDFAAAWFENEAHDIYPELTLEPCEKDIATRGEDRKEIKLSMIKDMLLNDKLYIAKECKWMIWEMVNYRKDDKGKIPKENDHLIDCLRYGLNAMMYDPTFVRIKNLVDNERRGYKLGEDSDKEVFNTLSENGEQTLEKMAGMLEGDY